MPKTKEAFSPINQMNTFSIIDYLENEIGTWP